MATLAVLAGAWKSYFLEVIIDGTSIGAQEMVSVPYSLYAARAGTADDDTSPDNEIQTLNISGNQLSLSDNGGSVDIPTSNWAANGDHISASNAGNVGIGTDSPTALLHSQISAAQESGLYFLQVTDENEKLLTNIKFVRS